MIRNLLLASIFTLGIASAAQADSGTSTYGAVLSSGGPVTSSNGEVVTIGGTLVEPDHDRSNNSGRSSGAAPAGAPSAGT